MPFLFPTNSGATHTLYFFQHQKNPVEQLKEKDFYLPNLDFKKNHLEGHTFRNGTPTPQFYRNISQGIGNVC